MSISARMRQIYETVIARGVGAAPLVYNFRDEFTTSDAAPVTDPRTPEPGPGVTDFTDPNSRFSIATDMLILGTNASNTDTLVSFEKAGGGAHAHVNGWAFAWLDYVRTASGSYPGLTTTEIATPAYRFEATGGTAIRENGNAVVMTSAYVFTTADRYAMVRLPNGRILYLMNNSLVWVSIATTTAALFAVLGTNTGLTNVSLGAARAATLTAPWDTNTGLCTDVKAGNQAAGTTFTQTGDALLLFDCDTLPSAGEIVFFFRVQDASNYWQITLESTGKLDLDEIVAGVPTQRGTSAAAAFNGARVSIMCLGTTINVYTATNLKINYTSATNFQAATAGELDALGTGGAISDIEAWPLTLPATPLAELDSFFA